MVGVHTSQSPSRVRMVWTMVCDPRLNLLFVQENGLCNFLVFMHSILRSTPNSVPSNSKIPFGKTDFNNTKSYLGSIHNLRRAGVMMILRGGITVFPCYDLGELWKISKENDTEHSGGATIFFRKKKRK